MSQEHIEFTPLLLNYLQQVGFRQHPLQKELHKKTQKLPYGNMQSAPEVTALVELLIKIIGAKRILEIGTFAGYTTLGMALATSKDGKVITCEKSADIIKIGQSFWEQAGIYNKITVEMGDALQTLEKYDENSFDFVYIDADKKNYPNYYEKCLNLTRSGGIIVMDNTLWKGKVIKEESNDSRVPILQKLNNLIHKDKRIDCCLIPISDGVTIIRKL